MAGKKIVSGMKKGSIKKTHGPGSNHTTKVKVSMSRNKDTSKRK